ncbi:hypothetical protein PIB30_054628 [Stylosanthes scabra]|uniref:Retrotransposon Copia-like N-terminal domain-containing protein n=1 Tax=Stylosanthes scabra TaxID=79078 RepID=A0ABU6UIB4_9FABA|nr:hypothetical protein [Stylosanthes scabra]
MALFLTDSSSTFKSRLIPLTDKLDEKNYSTWKFQAWLTIQTLELEDHLDPSKTPSPVESETEAESAIQNPSTAGATPTQPPQPAAKTDKSAAYHLWRKHDLALQTWLAASISKPY